MDIKKISVFGTGLMGKGIIQSIASKGYEVQVFSKSNDAEMRMVEYLNNEIIKGRLDKNQKDLIMQNLKFYNYFIEDNKTLIVKNQIEEIQSSDLIIETISENKNDKNELFNKISQYCTYDAIIATNTSTLSNTELGANITNPSRFCGMHFFSPVPMMSLVEIVKSLRTSQECLLRVSEFCKKIGKEPIIVNDTPGFVLNRILLSLILEAIRIVEEGTATVENVDKVAVLGMNLKLGPLKLADLIGLDIVKASIDNLFDEFKDNKFRPSILLTNMVRAGCLGKKTGKGFYEYIDK